MIALAFLGGFSFQSVFLAALILAIAVSGLASSILRSASAELNADKRDAIFRGESKFSKFFTGLEWLGIALIVVGMTSLGSGLFKYSSQRLFCIAGGVLLFCAVNSISSWMTFSIYQKEAPQTKATDTAKRAALMVTLAELLIVGVICWQVYVRVDWNYTKTAKSGDGDAPAQVESDEPGAWLDESFALKELAKWDKEYVAAMVESGKIRTRTKLGKKQYNAQDVEVLKNKKQDQIPD